MGDLDNFIPIDLVFSESGLAPVPENPEHDIFMAYSDTYPDGIPLSSEYSDNRFTVYVPAYIGPKLFIKSYSPALAFGIDCKRTRDWHFKLTSCEFMLSDYVGNDIPLLLACHYSSDPNPFTCDPIPLPTVELNNNDPSDSNLLTIDSTLSTVACSCDYQTPGAQSIA
ncbi:MAG: hypothetical protein Harvfovirus22_1, partial [Harvfovirus sp.]